MNKSTFSLAGIQVLRKLALISGLLLLLSVIGGAVIYIATSYGQLANWYLSIGGCFYKQADWTTQYFTPAVKDAGNWLALIGCVMAAVGAVALLKQWKYSDHEQSPPATNTGTGILWYTGVAVMGAALAIWEWQLLLPASDEVFSVVKCTELPAFQSLSYYMLPNNHVYFNVINKVFFGWGADLVQSGRLISVAAYGGLLVTVFSFFRRVTGSYPVAFFILLPVALEIYTLGFAAQARGYELYLLCGWLAFTSLIQSGDSTSRYANRNTMFNIAGFLLIPSYLYFYLAQLIFVLATRKISSKYLLNQFWLGTVVFLCYLPALCFSGISSFTSNGWVKPATDSFGYFIPHFTSTLVSFISDCFCGIGGRENFVNYLIFSLPFLLLFSKKGNHRHILLFYVSVWVAFILYSMAIKRIPFHRTLIIHFSITMAICVYTFYLLTKRAVAYVPKLRQVVQVILFTVPIVGYSAYLIQYNNKNVSTALYGYNVNEIHTAQINAVKQIPAGSTVSFSDDAFYYFYYCRKMGYKANRCPEQDAAYFIKIADRPFPTDVGSTFELMADAGNDYAIYKKR